MSVVREITLPSVLEIEANQAYFEALKDTQFWGFNKKTVCYLCKKMASEIITLKDQQGTTLQVAQECFEKSIDQFKLNGFKKLWTLVKCV